MISQSFFAEHRRHALEAAHRASLKSLEAVAGLTETWLNAGRESVVRSSELQIGSREAFDGRPLVAALDPQVHACTVSLHLIAKGYADLVGIAEAYWYQGRMTLESGLRDLARHSPAGSETGFAGMVRTLEAVEHVADEAAQASVVLAEPVTDGGELAAPAARSRRKSSSAG